MPMKVLIAITLLAGVFLGGCSSRPAGQGGGDVELRAASARPAAADPGPRWPSMAPVPQESERPALNLRPGMEKPDEDGPDFFLPKHYETLHI